MTDALDCIDTFLQGKRPIAYYPEIGHKLKSESAGVLLCQFIYWRKKGLDPDGWVYKSAAEIEAETGLTYEKQLNARKKLKSLGLIEERHKRIDHQIDFRVSMSAFQEVFQVVESVPSGQSPIGEMGKTHLAIWAEPISPVGQNPVPEMGKAQEAVGQSPFRYKEAEITTETTTEITNKHTPVLVEIPGSTKSSIEDQQKQWFTEFWGYYWRKDDKIPAWRAFKKHIRSEERNEQMLEALRAVAPEMLAKDKQFRPMAATWLNKEPWEGLGEVSPPVTALVSSQPQRFNTARPSRKELASMEFDRRVMREYGGVR